MIEADELEKIFKENSEIRGEWGELKYVMHFHRFREVVSALIEKEYTRGFLEGAIHERTYEK